MNKCPTCGDDGWYIDHTDECYEAGDCVGCGGIQKQCDNWLRHSDQCNKCDGNGQVWDPTEPGNVGFCHHCTGGRIWRA